MKTSHRIQEWLADRLSFVQYPNIRAADDTTREVSRFGFRFTYPMPLGKRLDMFIISFGLLLVGLVATAIVGLFLYLLL